MKEHSSDRIVPMIGSTKTVGRLCERVNALLLRLERAEDYLRKIGETECEVCGAWMHTAESTRHRLRGAYMYQGKRTCHDCLMGMLRCMVEDDGPEWEPFCKAETQKASMLELAEIGLRVPAIGKAANAAMACLSEEPGISQAWTAARLTVSIRYA